jgi:zinc protease
MSARFTRFISGAALLIGALLMLSAVSPAEEVKEYQLDNGLKVLLKENHNAPVINLNIAYRVGSKYEVPGITGISHLIEHMMFKTTKHLALDEFDKRLKAVGADDNAYTWLDQTVYHETIAANKIDVALELEAERMCNLACLPVDHQFEMTVVRNELEQRDDSPFTLLYEEFMSAAFKAHPYKTPTIGWKDDVESITTDEIKSYYERYYHPDNAFIVAVGDFKPDALFAKIKQYFDPLPSGNVKLPRLGKEPAQIGERRFEIRRAGQMDYILCGWHVPASTDPDAYALEVLGNILGQGRTSRLYKALVDTGECAQASAWSSAFGYAEPFLFMAMATVSPGVDPAEVEPLIYKQIEALATDGASAGELQRAKKQARVAFVYNKDSIEQEADAIINFELAGDWRRLDEYLPGIEAVTAADVQRVAAKYLTQENRTAGIYRAIRPAGAGGAAGAVAPAGPAAGDDEQLGPPAAPASWPHGGALPETSAPASALSRAGHDAGLTSSAHDGKYATLVNLKNGLRVVVHENHNNQTVSVRGLVCAGRLDDPADKPGVGAMAVALLANGTEEHSKQELAELLEGSGIELGFSAGRETFGFSGRSLSEDFPLLLDLLAEQLLTPAFPEAEVELVRQQTLAGLLSSMDDTFDTSLYRGLDLLYGASPCAGRVEGTPESVRAIMRADLLAWYKAEAVPDGAVLAIVGDVNADEAVAAVEKRFGLWRGSGPAHAEHLALGDAFVANGGRREVVSMPDKSNASLMWMGPGPSKLGDDWPQRGVAVFILGGDFLSRLNERLRVKDGLTYGSFATLRNGRAAGPFCVNVQVNPVNVEPAIEAATEELQRYAQTGPTADELRLAQDYLEGNFPVQLSTNGDVARTLVDAVYYDRGIGFVQTYPARIEAVTLKQVRAVAAQYCDPAKLLLVIAGTVGER